jgi:RHS repeat-associated protein
MPVNTYITANGRIRRRITTDEEKVTEQVAVVTNALGSVVATYKDGWLTADRSYDPYGETRAEWNDVGRFGWVGGLGYRETRREWVTHYVRARHYGYPMGMWTSVDPLWPTEAAFGYVGGTVAKAVDPTGLTKTKLCSVYFCDVLPGRFGIKPGHRFTCVSIIRPDGTRRSCSGGLNPRSDGVDQLVGPGVFGDDNYPCPVAGLPDVKCSLVVAGDNNHDICRFADEVCKCLEKGRKNPGLYAGLVNNCVHFSYWVLACACQAARPPGLLGNLCEQFLDVGFRKK